MIDQNQLSVLFGVCIVPQVVVEAKASYDTSEETIIREFYASHVFDKLQNPSTGLWNLSAKTLAEMFVAERQGRDVEFPEEQS